MSRKSIYLTGWEYNRLVQADPTSPRQSGLPAESLWNGGALFWMFETVYCTKESYETEQQVDDLSQEATREIWAELKDEGILQPYDLASLTEDLHEKLRYTHKQLRTKYNDEALRTLIREGNVSELETIKSELLQPVMTELGCAQNVSPNSIKNWFRRQLDPSSSKLATADALHELATTAQLGTSLCERPGTGLDPETIEPQKLFEKRQRPIIPDLFLGYIPMQDYVKTQIPHADAFKPISGQLKDDWSRNKSKLFSLREKAQRFIWDDLHNDWLPRLEHDPKFRSEFNGLVRDAINRARMGPLFDWITRLVVVVFPTAIGASVGGVAGAIFGAVGGVVAQKPVDDKLKASEKLTLFYQEALRLAKGSASAE